MWTVSYYNCFWEILIEAVLIDQNICWCREETKTKSPFQFWFILHLASYNILINKKTLYYTEKRMIASYLNDFNFENIFTYDFIII